MHRAALCSKGFNRTLAAWNANVGLGCSIGQGMSAFTLLAFSAPITFAAIFAEAALGLRQLIVGFFCC